MDADAPSSGPPERHAKDATAGSGDVAATGAPKRRAKHGDGGSGDVAAGVEAVSAAIAGGQAGVVTWDQLRRAGITEAAIKHRATNGHLHRMHRGVYLVGHTALPPRAKEIAALLACGERAVLSRWSAAHLWGLTEMSPDHVYVTVVGRRRRPREGVVVRTTTRLTREDIRRRHGVQLTSPARTVIDLAAESDSRTFDRLIAEARVRKLLRAGELEKALSRAGSRAGVAAVRTYLDREKDPPLTRSEAEGAMRRLVQQAGLPQPICNARLGEYEVDFFWPEQRLIVEVDGYLFHGHRAAFERDRRKQLALVAAGYRVIRITWMQLLHEPLLVAAKLAQALTTGS